VKTIVNAEENTVVSTPYALSLYNDIKTYGVLLVDGGLLDQPWWLWQIVKASGIMYERLLAEAKEEKELNEAAEKSISESVQAGLLKKYQQQG